jgi:4-hydroxy-tetrahydrodipicolinate synthase
VSGLCGNGASAVAIVAPFYYKLTSESVYAYFAEIARHSPIDLTLYNIPLFASPIDLPTIERLAKEFPRVVGIKDSSGDLAFMMRMIASIRPSRRPVRCANSVTAPSGSAVRMWRDYLRGM